jgi:hypothetical protein
MQKPPDSLNHLLRSALLARLDEACSQAVRATVKQLDALRPEMDGFDKRIRSRQDRPNLFDILADDGFIDYREERLHSKLLHHLLDPHSNRHGLNDSFLRSVLEKMAGCFRVNGAACKDPSLQGLSDTVVTLDKPIESAEERGRPDLYLRNERSGFAVLLENKVRHHERPHQLKDYWEAAQERDPEFKIGGLFLTPERRDPVTADGYPYVSLSYGDMADLLEKALEDMTAANAEYGGLPKQYADAIRRWFVLDPEEKRLAWQILQRYPKAIKMSSGLVHTKKKALFTESD